MYNARYVILGIIIFVVFFTSPFWMGMFGNEGEYKRPAVTLPENEKKCIEDVEYMRAEHMQLLNNWRDEALRNEHRTYVAKDGKKWEISLQNTCMKCHADYDDFCKKCHDSNSVYPYCWDCHIKPEGKK